MTGKDCALGQVNAKAVETLECSDENQWKAIKELQKRPPVWATAVISLLSFLLGCSLTYAGLITRMAGK